MVNTVKFSQFAVAPLTSGNNEVVGLESGVNVQSVRFLTWTTVGRPATPFNGLLGLNTSLSQYEYWSTTTNTWVQLVGSNILPLLASHALGEGASLIGLQDQSNVTSKTVQDLANATFIAQTDNGTLQNAQFLGSLTTGIVKNTTSTGVLSISAPLTSIDGLTTVAHQFLITTAPDTYGTLGALTDGQLIIGATGLAPSLATLTAGSGVTILNAPGSITISATGTGGTVTSLSAGTGITLTPNPITTTGSIALTIPVAVTSGGTGLISFALGDTLYASAANVLSALAGNITTAKQYLSQTGTGAVSAAPVWATISGGDITGAALTKTDDTNVTLTLGGTPSTALLRAASLTLGWTGQLAVPRGGTGNSTFTAFSLICAGTTATGAFQNVVGVGTLNQVLVSQGAGALPIWSSVPGVVPAALTKTDDTNVTLTLGGTPATALLQATSLTLGWTGLLSLARGGTNANLTASNGGIFYSTATAAAILAGTATAGQLLQSGANAAPNWTIATFPSTATGTGTFLRADGTNWIASSNTLPNTSVLGDTLYSSAANVISILSGNITTTKQYLSQTGNGAVSAAPVWATIAGADITGAALTKTDDTNVTMTLGGTPTTALLRAASMTLGWTGQLSVARGGTGLATATAHNLLIGNGTSALTLLAPSATSGIPLISQGASSDPAYGTAVVSGGGTGNTTFTAYSVICAGTTATGAFQNVSGVGTSGQVLVSNGAAALPTWQSIVSVSAFNQVAVQRITSSGTYTPTTGMKYCIIEVQGAGGGGGGCAATGNCSGGGGGAGGYISALYTAAQIGASQTVTIGAAGTAGTAGNNAGGTGGATSVGTLLSANGGGGGSGNAGAASPTFGVNGGSGGSVSLTTGTLLKAIGGGAGFSGCNAGATFVGWSPSGANSPFGNGGVSSVTGAGAGVAAPANSGAGGSGGFGAGGSQAGGAGGSGLVTITEFLSV